MKHNKTIEVKYASLDFQQKIEHILKKKIILLNFSLDNIQDIDCLPSTLILYETLLNLKIGSYGKFSNSRSSDSKYYLYKYSNEKVLVIDFSINGLKYVYNVNDNFKDILLEKIDNIFDENLFDSLRNNIVIESKCTSELSSEICC
jgi:hypothetical protein